MSRKNHPAAVRLMWLTVLAVLVVTCLSAAFAADYPYTTTTNDQVNLRRSASTSSTRLASIPEGAVLEVLGRSGNYYQVRYQGQTGYVVKSYVNDDPGVVITPTPVPPVSGYPYKTTTNDQVNLREKKSTSSDKLASIPEGAEITVQEVSGSYARVIYRGEEGWCLKKYVNLRTVKPATAAPPSVATPAPELSDDVYTLLQVGSRGSRVRALQEALIELGYLSGTADGVYGAGTRSAVAKFQEINEYPTTGIADQNLQAFLYTGTPKNSAGKKTEIDTLSPLPGVSIRLNNKGELVGTVQTRLQQLGYYQGAVTCVYDKATRDAVRAFQKKNGLAVDGVCGVKTREALMSAAALTPDATPTPKPTPSPTPAPTFQMPSDTVRRGDSGADARLVQQRLIDLGYLKGKADGKFGSDSQKALEAFQRKHNLKADGVAGAATQAVLFSHTALSVDATPTPAPTAAPVTPAPTATPEPAELTPDNVVIIRKGTSGWEVLRLQQRLTALGYYQAMNDGVCKADDVAAIKAFQKKNGLTADGVAGYDTQSKLYSITAITDSGDMAGGTVDSYKTLRRGDSGAMVRQLQMRLISLGYLSGTADGKYGAQTAEAVYAFQKVNGLVRDGIAGAETQQKVYSAAAARPTPAPTTGVVTDQTIQLATSNTLRRGDVSASVKAMQQRLISLGYLSGDADGKFGALTYKALKAFQKANDLEADGIAGKITLSVLSSVNAQGAGSTGNTGNSGTSGNAGTTGGTTQVIPNVTTVTARDVQYASWYNVIRAQARKYPYATVYDPASGISWQIHMFSLGAHADAEPITAADTAKMLQAFGGNDWNPKPVWVILSNGEVYLATTHSMEHGIYHNGDNNFDGHVCFHFPRTMAQVTAIGKYATSHQLAVDKAWSELQKTLK